MIYVSDSFSDEIHQFSTDVEVIIQSPPYVVEHNPMSLSYCSLRGKKTLQRAERGALNLIYTTCAWLIIFLNAYNHNKLAAHCRNKSWLTKPKYSLSL